MGAREEMVCGLGCLMAAYAACISFTYV
jgi:hypothetical protein